MNEELEYYLQELRKSATEDEFFNLIELDDSLVPEMIEAYWRRIRHSLLEASWQHRSLATLNFLGEALKTTIQKSEKKVSMGL